MIAISETQMDAFAATQQRGFLDRVHSLILSKFQIAVPHDELQASLDFARARGLQSERDCAAFMSTTAVFCRKAEHAAWSRAQLHDPSPVSMNIFIAEARSRAASLNR